MSLIKDFFTPKPSGGKYVDNHTFIDKNRPGVRKTNGRMYDIYDQSDRATKVHAKTGYIDPMQWIWSGAIAVIVWIIGFNVPKLPIINLILYKHITLKTAFFIFIAGLVGGAISLGMYFITQTYDNAGENEAREMTSNDFNDAYLVIPEEMPENYDIAPDNKAHFNVDVTSFLSHEMIKQVPGLKGKDGKVKIDNKFSNALFDTARVPKDLRKIFNPHSLLYNPDKKHGKAPYKTVYDAINSTWHIPDCEDPDSQDPSGAYIVQTAPENTIVISETRGGKGQKYIEPILDVWSRQDEQPNIVTTDLKMELLVKGLRMFTLRGYNVRALNMLVDDKTDAINFLGYAVNAAVRNDLTRMETVVNNLSKIYFPEDSKGGSDPVWNQSASAVFKRTIYGLIEYYSEEIKALNDQKLTSEQRALRADELWGKVSPYNAYNFIVALSSKMYDRESFDEIYSDYNRDSQPDAEQKSGLTVYFDAVQSLPQNSLRAKINEQNQMLVSASGSEKMMASIYAITLASLIFFTDNKIINLTSARPSENLDLEGFSFPRRLAFKFNTDYAKKHGLLGSMVRWRCYKDPAMTDGFWTTKDGQKIFDPDYEDSAHGVNKFGWVDGYFKGRFPKNTMYIKVEFFDPDGYVQGHDDTNLLLAEYNFIFKKSYRKNRSGRSYLINKITGKKEVNGGTLTEYQYVNGHVNIKPAEFHVKRKSLLLKEYGGKGKVQDQTLKVIESIDCHYLDGPTILYLVAPPHTTTYNSLLLTTISLVYNYQVENAYLGRPSQKPFYKTKYLLDEFGNMESKGKGIDDLDKKLTSGLGQDQQFTLILQSFSQLDTLYGNDMSKTLMGNVGNYFYMKSKEKASIQQLIDMSGKKHVIQETNVQSSTPVNGYHLGNLMPKSDGSQNAVPQISKSYGREERSILNENDFLKLNTDATDGNAIVTVGGDPIVSKTSNIFPMSFQLLSHRTGGDGKDIQPTNLPVSSDTTTFNALQNLPNFEEMIANRIMQASLSVKVRKRYMELYNATDSDLRRMDQDKLADELMRGINENLPYKKAADAKSVKNDATIQNYNDKVAGQSRSELIQTTDHEIGLGNKEAQIVESNNEQFVEQVRASLTQAAKKDDDAKILAKMFDAATHDNQDFLREKRKAEQNFNEKHDLRYAHKTLSKEFLYDDGRPIHSNDDILAEAFDNSKTAFREPDYHLTQDNGVRRWFVNINGDSKMIVEENMNDKDNRYTITDEFLQYLASFDSWTNSNDRALVKFDTEVYLAKQRKDNHTNE